MKKTIFTLIRRVVRGMNAAQCGTIIIGAGCVEDQYIF